MNPILEVFSCLKTKFVLLLSLCLFFLQTASVSASQELLWLEPVKYGYLADGSAYCDFAFKSTDPEFSLSDVNMKKSLCLHYVRKEKLAEAIGQENITAEGNVRITTPIYSSAFLYINANYKGTPYVLQSQARLLGKSRNFNQWTAQLRRNNSNGLEIPYLNSGKRAYLMKGQPLTFQYDNSEAVKSSSVRIYSPLNHTSESSSLNSARSFSYTVPAAKPLNASSIRLGDTRVFTVHFEDDGKDAVLSSFLQFYDNRYSFRNLQHGLFVFSAGVILTAAAFLYYLRRTSYHGSN